MVPTGTKLPVPNSFQFLFLFYFLFSSHFLFFFYSQTITNHNHMNCNHIFHKSCTITITSIAQSKSTQETSLAITIKKQVLHNQETSFCNHNPETIASTTLPQSRRPPLPPARRRCPTRAPDQVAAPPRREASRPAPGMPPRAGRPRAPALGGRSICCRRPLLDLRRWPA